MSRWVDATSFVDETFIRSARLGGAKTEVCPVSTTDKKLHPRAGDTCEMWR